MVVFTHHGDDGKLSLNSQMEGALLEWKHVRRRQIRSRAFWEDKKHEIVLTHVLSSGIHCLDSRSATLAVNKG